PTHGVPYDLQGFAPRQAIRGADGGGHVGGYGRRCGKIEAVLERTECGEWHFADIHHRPSPAAPWARPEIQRGDLNPAVHRLRQRSQERVEVHRDPPPVCSGGLSGELELS